MGKDTVAILMSTYNGHDYIGDQIQSIINQTFQDWKLYIRDDGSSDSTVEIIKNIQKKDKRIVLINDSNGNMGSVKSFFHILRNVNADFYMFADQDDYWLENKISDTLVAMKKLEYVSKPCCVYTNLQIVNDRLEGDEVFLKKTWDDFSHLLFTNVMYGCTMMINQRLKETINFSNINYSNIYVHDWWIALISAAFGQISYLDSPTILYRQHGDNQVGASKKSIGSIMKRLFNQDRDRTAMVRSVHLANEFETEYGNYPALNKRNKMYVSEYGKLVQDSGFWHNLILAFKLPPQSIYKLKELFYVYIMVCFHHDYLN